MTTLVSLPAEVKFTCSECGANCSNKWVYFSREKRYCRKCYFAELKTPLKPKIKPKIKPKKK